jgi:hypothetical protein
LRLRSDAKVFPCERHFSVTRTSGTSFFSLLSVSRAILISCPSTKPSGLWLRASRRVRIAASAISTRLKRILRSVSCRANSYSSCHPSEPRSGTEDESLRETIGPLLIREAERFYVSIVRREIGCACPVASMHSYAARPGNKGQPGGQRSVAAQFAQKTTPLSFRSQVYRRGICLLPAAKQQILRATLPRFGMTFLWGIFKLHRYRMFVGVDLTDANH